MSFKNGKARGSNGPVPEQSTTLPKLICFIVLKIAFFLFQLQTGELNYLICSVDKILKNFLIHSVASWERCGERCHQSIASYGTAVARTNQVTKTIVLSQS